MPNPLYDAHSADWNISSWSGEPLNFRVPSIDTTWGWTGDREFEPFTSTFNGASAPSRRDDP